MTPWTFWKRLVNLLKPSSSIHPDQVLFLLFIIVLVGLDEKMDKRKSHIIKYCYPAANVSFLFCHLILPLLHNLAKCKSSKMIPGYSLFFQPEFPSISLFLVKLMSVEKLWDMWFGFGLDLLAWNAHCSTVQWTESFADVANFQLFPDVKPTRQLFS